MRDWKEEAEGHAVKQAKAAKKLADQTADIKTQTGDAQDKTGAQVLNEMRQNKASVDLNRAMFEYVRETKNDGD